MDEKIDIKNNKIAEFTERYIITKANQKLSYDEIHDIKVSLLRTIGLGSLVGGGAAFYQLRQIIINESLKGVFLTFRQKAYRISKYGFIGFLLSLPYSLKYNFSDQSRAFIFQTPYRAAYIYTHHQHEIDKGTSPILPTLIEEGGILKSKLLEPKTIKPVRIKTAEEETPEEEKES